MVYVLWLFDFKKDIKLKGILNTICYLATMGNNFLIVLHHICLKSRVVFMIIAVGIFLFYVALLDYVYI